MKTPFTNMSSFLLPIIITLTGNVFAQQSNFLFPVPELERRFQFDDLDIFRFKDVRPNRESNVRRVILHWQDGSYTQAKWKRAPENGHATNNAPRYEIAAYKYQKLFLDPDEYVVPPTVMRTLALTTYREIEDSYYELKPTFGNCNSVCFVLQYWLENVSSDNVFDKKRAEKDAKYARSLANANIFSYLIRHNDANIGNFLVSTTSNPLVFAVDNGMAFNSRESEQGHEWREIRVKHLPGDTIGRIRKIGIEELRKTLGVVCQFEIIDGELQFRDPGDNIDPDKGVRVSGGIVQFGLTKDEIGNVFKRQQWLLERVDSGKIETFQTSR